MTFLHSRSALALMLGLAALAAAPLTAKAGPGAAYWTAKSKAPAQPAPTACCARACCPAATATACCAAPARKG